MNKSLLLALCLAACSSVPRLEGAAPTDFFLRDQDGKAWSTAELKDKTILIDFWAPWCAPCLKAIPELNLFHAKHGKKVLLLGIAIEEKGWDAVKPAMEKHGIKYPVALGLPALGKAYGVRGFPYLVVLHQGKIAMQLLGSHKLKDLEKKLAEYLK